MALNEQDVSKCGQQKRVAGVFSRLNKRHIPGGGGGYVTICTHHTSYNMGGVATISRITAREFANQGYKVSLLTKISDGKFAHKGVKIRTDPSPLRCLIEILKADYVICEGPIFRICWPLLFIPKKSIVVKHGPVTQKQRFLRRVFEKWLSLNAAWCGVAKYVAEREVLKTTVVPNACDPEIFHKGDAMRSYDLVFVGSLTTNKGVDLLFEALQLLRQRGIVANRLTLVGEGPLRTVYEKRLEDGKFLGTEVVFTGNLNAEGVAEEMRKHKYLIVPSSAKQWKEAFPCVCLEGAMCGCTVIASDSGGMPEAVGPSGLVFKCDDAEALAAGIEKFMTGKATVDKEAVRQHLSNYTPSALVRAYLGVMRGERELKG